MYFTDRGVEELADRRGEEEVSLSWLADRLRDFTDLNPEFEIAIDRLATWLARLDSDDELLAIHLDYPWTRHIVELCHASSVPVT